MPLIASIYLRLNEYGGRIRSGLAPVIGARGGTATPYLLTFCSLKHSLHLDVI